MTDLDCLFTICVVVAEKASEGRESGEEEIQSQEAYQEEKRKASTCKFKTLILSKWNRSLLSSSKN